MTEAATKLLADALCLPAEERRRIAELLLDSVASASHDEIQASWVSEAIRRGDALERGDTVAIDGDTAQRELKAKFSRPAP